MTWRIINRYEVANEKGHAFTLFEWQDFIPSGTLESPADETPGARKLTLQDGSRVNTTDEIGVFETLEGEKLRIIK
ncbi:UNVERIFIED_ORG: hypothetical protein BCL66_102186 [Martelella mediterranea]